MNRGDPGDALTEEHMRVLQWLEDHPGTSLEAAAHALDLAVADVETLCADLADAGMIERTRRKSTPTFGATAVPVP